MRTLTMAHFRALRDQDDEPLRISANAATTHLNQCQARVCLQDVELIARRGRMGFGILARLL